MIEFKNNLYITKKELEKVIQILPNAQDKFFMMCLFYGLGSKKFSILGNLKKNQIDLIKKEIVLEDKKISMDDYFCKIAKQTLEQKVYQILFANSRTADEYDIVTRSDYVITAKPSTKNNGLVPLSFMGLKVRFKTIKKFLDLEGLTVNSLETSYVIEHLLRIKINWTVVEITIELNKMQMNMSPYRVYTIMNNIKNDFLKEIKEI